MPSLPLLRKKARSYFAISMYKEASEIYFLIAKNNALKPEDAFQLSYCLCKLQGHQTAYPILINYIKSTNLSPDKLSMAHKLLYRCVSSITGDKREILNHLGNAVKYNPASSSLRFEAASVYFGFEEYALCKNSCRAARALGIAETKVAELEARADFEIECQEAKDSNYRFDLINKIQPSSQKTIFLNLGFAKCGSTFLQSSVWPYLPFNKYQYLGRYYRKGIHSRLEGGLQPYDGQNSFAKLLHKATTCIEAKAKLSLFLKKKLETNNLLCFSSEILPDAKAAIESYELIKGLIPEANFVHLIVLRPPLDVAWSSYAHKMLYRHFKGEELISFDDRAFLSGHKNYKYAEPAQMYFESVEGSKICTELKSLTNSKDLWNTIFSSLSNSKNIANT